MELQHVNVKLPLKEDTPFDLELVIPIFHAWIQDQALDERLLSVADYRHVPQGPGVLLIGHEGDYSLDESDGRRGVRYNRKTAIEGSNDDRLRQAMRAALYACQRLEEHPALQGKLCFNGQDIELFINDRLLAPNTNTTRMAVEPELRQFFTEMLGGAEYSLSFSSDGDPRRLFGVSLKTPRVFAAADLLANVG